ncbi:hypothetical protein [Kitasatospora sp. NPDC004289]
MTTSTRSTAGLWAVLMVLCLCAAGLAAFLGLSLTAPRGRAEHVALTACETRHGGRDGYVQCTGLLPDGTQVSLRHDGHPGESVDAVRTPWGSYAVPRPDLPARALALTVPLLLLVAAAASGAALRSALRRRR